MNFELFYFLWEIALFLSKLFDLTVIFFCDFVDMLYGFDYMTVDELLVFLSHHQERCFYLTYHSLEFFVYLVYICLYSLIFSLELVTTLSEAVIATYLQSL